MRQIIRTLSKRRFTNFIHFVLDNLVPPVIRDKKWFMYPWFYLAYKGKNVEEYMEFKSKIYSIEQRDLENMYKNYDTIGTDRPTDLNTSSLKYILNNLTTDAGSVLDVGCGRGYFLQKVSEMGYKCTGCDVLPEVKMDFANYQQGNVENLPFDNNQFDIVTCNHTLEHVLDVKKAIKELKRIARNQLVITVPRQRFNYYTLDLHLHFFPKKEILENLINIPGGKTVNRNGDWVFIVNF